MEAFRTGDPGLFGPDSVTWQMHGDPMMWVAGVRALYLQALHPRAVRGVMQNSDFRRLWVTQIITMIGAQLTAARLEGQADTRPGPPPGAV